jgi:hypothetical protein
VGFTSASADAQAKAEKVFVETVNPASARKWLAALTEEPHVAGTPAEKKLADYVLARFKEFGIERRLVRYDVFLNHPKHVSLKLVSPVEEELKLTEDPYDVDKDSTQDGMFPAFHGYGASGKAEGQVVYVNYGVPADFARLESMGISVEGKIVLARYGAAFRGLKVKEAQDRGALGVLIYSDPRDDGYMAGRCIRMGRCGRRRRSSGDRCSFSRTCRVIRPRRAGRRRRARSAWRASRWRTCRRSRRCRSRTQRQRRSFGGWAVLSCRRSGRAVCRSRITSALAPRASRWTCRWTRGSSRSTT